MKKLITTAIIFVSLSGLGIAGEIKNDYEYCKVYSEMAETLMWLRQCDVDPEKLMSMALERGLEEADLVKVILRDAYSYPLYEGDVKKSLAVKQFRIKYYLKCLSTK